MRLAHGCHGGHRVRQICQRRSHGEVGRHVLVGGLGALLFQGAETLVLVFLLLAVVDDWVSLLAGLVRAAVPVGATVSMEPKLASSLRKLTAPGCRSERKPCCTEGRRMGVPECACARA